MSAYLDGELPREEKLSLESHLAACPECSRALAELKQVSAVFKKHAMQPAPMSLKDAVFAKARKQAVFYFWFKPAAALSAAAAGLLLILNLPKSPDRETPQPELFPRAVSAQPAAGGLAAENAQPFDGYSGMSAAAVRGAGAPKYPALSLRKKAYAQAKSAVSARSKAPGSVSFSAGSPAGGSAPPAFFAAGNVQSKRAAPVTVPDIVADGVRFSAAHWREDAGKPRNGGSVRAFDAHGGELLWEVRVYEAVEDPRMEADVQQVHISALALSGKRLEITDESGNRYRLDISTRQVEKLSR